MTQDAVDVCTVELGLQELTNRTGLTGGESVLVYETSNVSPHFETSIEIAVLLSLIGCDVYYIFAGYNLPRSAYYNKFTRSRRGLRKDALKELVDPTDFRIRRIFERYNKKLNAKVKVVEKYSFRPVAGLCCLEEGDVSSIRALTYKGCSDYGESIAGSLCAITGEENTLVRGKLLKEAQRFSDSYITSYQIISLAEQELGFSFHSAVVFNGRFPWIRGAIQRLKESDARVFFHERGPSMHRYFLSDSEPHKRVAYQEDCRLLWKNRKDRVSCEAIGKSYYINQREGADQVWTSFSKEQVNGLAKQILEKGKASCSSGRTVLFFSSSENELLAIRDFWQAESPASFEWNSQRHAVEMLARACQEVGHQLIVRVHPHMRKKTNSIREQWDGLCFLNKTLRRSVIVVKSDSLVSSYELLDGADVIVSNGSTVGIEAVYWNKPSILLGHAYYDETGVTLLKPYTYKQLVGHLRDFEEHRVDPSSAVPYGYFMKVHGVPHCIYKPRSLFKGKI